MEVQVAGSREDLEADGVVFESAAAAEPALEMAGGTGTGIEDRAEAVAVSEWIVRRPLVFEQLPSLGHLGGARRWAPDNRQAVGEEQPEYGQGGATQGAEPEQAALAGRRQTEREAGES